MTIELPSEIEAQLRNTAAEQGISVSQYLEALVTENSVRRRQLAEFRSAIAERVDSLNAGEIGDGEEAMARLIAALPQPR
jgi:predicted transcriptional regulator